MKLSETWIYNHQIMDECVLILHYKVIWLLKSVLSPPIFTHASSWRMRSLVHAHKTIPIVPKRQENGLQLISIVGNLI